jgi:hypothetical protein
VIKIKYTNMKNTIIKMLSCLASTLLAATSLIAQDNAIALANLSNCQTQLLNLTCKAGSSISYSLSTNQIVVINGITSGSVYMVTFNGMTNVVGAEFGDLENLTLTGLVSIKYTEVSNPSVGVASFKILTPSTNGISVIPMNSVVIPSDANGNVEITLESSSDLINWIPSQPGLYGNTYTNRFFRVRALSH